jgi:putative membrane protein
MTGTPPRTRWIAPAEIDPAAARALPDPVADADTSDGVPTAPETVVLAPRRRWRLGTWLAAGIGGVVAIGMGLDAWDLIGRAFATAAPLGWAVAVLLGVSVAALTAMVWREMRSLARLGRIDGLRTAADRLTAAAGHGGAAAWLAELRALYAGRADMRPQLDALDRHVGDQLDDVEIMRLAERALLRPLDRRAYALVTKAARDTAIGTAVSPAAVLDAAIVVWRNLRLVREIAALYGARPGWLGSVRLLRRMLENLTVAGAAETADGLVADAVGGGLAAALSSRIGQGVINGLLTARVGLVAMHLCRPVTFLPEDRPGLGAIRRSLLTVPRTVL